MKRPKVLTEIGEMGDERCCLRFGADTSCQLLLVLVVVYFFHYKRKELVLVKVVKIGVVIDRRRQEFKVQGLEV